MSAVSKNKLSQIAAAAAGVLIGVFGTLGIVFFDDVRAWFEAARWNFPELANVKVQDCRISGLPSDLVTYAVSVKQGDLLTDLVIGQRALHATKAIDILVTRRDKPVVLVLSAERSVIWNLSIVKGVRLAAVLVLGGGAQGLVGIPKSIPHLVLAAEKKPDGCPDSHVKYVKLTRSPEFKAFDSVTASIIGHRIDFLQSAATGNRFFAGPHKALETVSIMRSDELDADYLKAADVMPFGRDGIDWLLNKGLIRSAHKKDVEAWVVGATPTDASLTTRLRTGRRMMLSRTFVILDKIALPDNLRWDGYYSFILPNGVPNPDYANEAAIYRMDDFTCAPTFACSR